MQKRKKENKHIIHGLFVEQQQQQQSTINKQNRTKMRSFDCDDDDDDNREMKKKHTTTTTNHHHLANNNNNRPVNKIKQTRNNIRNLHTKHTHTHRDMKLFRETKKKFRLFCVCLFVCSVVPIEMGKQTNYRLCMNTMIFRYSTQMTCCLCK